MCGEREEAFLGGSCLLISVSGAVGSSRAWRQPRGGQPLLVLDGLLKGLDINRASMKHLKLLCYYIFLSIKYLVWASALFPSGK
jgi:hypothetical protein